MSRKSINLIHWKLCYFLQNRHPVGIWLHMLRGKLKVQQRNFELETKSFWVTYALTADAARQIRQFTCKPLEWASPDELNCAKHQMNIVQWTLFTNCSSSAKFPLSVKCDQLCEVGLIFQQFGNLRSISSDISLSFRLCRSLWKDSWWSFVAADVS